MHDLSDVAVWQLNLLCVGKKECLLNLSLFLAFTGIELSF